MKVGTKVGPKDWKKTLLATKANYCEIWFRLDWQEKYTSLFKYLKKNKIAFGLHFWDMIDNKYFPNLLCLKRDLAAKTFASIKKTIDIANYWQATYVNFHPESYRLNLLNLDNSKIETLNLNEPIDRQQSFNQLLFYLKKIRKYAKSREVIPLIETVPKFTPSDFKNFKRCGKDIQKSEGLETEKFFQLAKMGFPVCFDIGHTIGQCITDNRDKLFVYLWKAAKKMLPNIGLIHVNTVIPPFNGVDSHNGILKKDFENGAFPDRKQLIKLLSLFKEKNIWLIPEPAMGKMVENYFELEKIVKEVNKRGRFMVC